MRTCPPQAGIEPMPGIYKCFYYWVTFLKVSVKTKVFLKICVIKTYKIYAYFIYIQIHINLCTMGNLCVFGIYICMTYTHNKINEIYYNEGHFKIEKIIKYFPELRKLNQYEGVCLCPRRNESQWTFKTLRQNCQSQSYCNGVCLQSQTVSTNKQEQIRLGTDNS